MGYILSSVLVCLLIFLVAIVIIAIVLCLSYYIEVLNDCWEDLDDDIIELMNRDCVIIYPHESYKDFFVALNYKRRYNKELNHVRFLMSPYFYSILPYRESIGAIRATSLRQKNGGSVSRIVRKLKDSDRFQFAISPKGTIKKGKRWRSGYWWIAKSLNVDIAVIGLNYEKKKAELVGVLTPTNNREQDEDVLKRWMNSVPQDEYGWD